ncbi:hypothetical protein ScPMuIL_001979 [Solemya velum]
MQTTMKWIAIFLKRHNYEYLRTNPCVSSFTIRTHNLNNKETWHQLVGHKDWGQNGNFSISRRQGNRMDCWIGLYIRQIYPHEAVWYEC